MDLVLSAAEDDLDAALAAVVAPLAAELDGHPGFDALRFQRHVKPDWNLRVSVEGTPDVEAQARRRAEGHLAALPPGARLRASRWEPTPPLAAEPDLQLPDGAVSPVRRILHADSAACLALLARERREPLPRGRRGFSIVLVERALDLFGFDRGRRIAFYQLAHRGPFDLGTWGGEDRDTLERRYQEIRGGLAGWFVASAADDADGGWGDEELARLAARALDGWRPQAEALAGEASRTEGAAEPPDAAEPTDEGTSAGARGGLVPLAVALCRRHGNRLGISGLGEATLRYFAYRLHLDGRGGLP